MVERNNLTPAYVGLYPVLSEIAMEHGYALAVHGSVKRDFDLVAIPWVDEATSSDELMQAFEEYILKLWSHKVTGPEENPHGRVAYTINLGAGGYIDLSIMLPFSEVNLWKEELKEIASREWKGPSSSGPTTPP